MIYICITIPIFLFLITKIKKLQNDLNKQNNEISVLFKNHKSLTLLMMKYIEINERRFS